MERFTNGTTGLKNISDCGKAIDRLAAYEDTGLTPEEVQELKVSVKKCEDCWNHAQIKAEGRLVVLPCEVGEIIDKYNELTKPMAEAPENYTTGYKNGHRNGQAELIAYLFQIDTGACAEAEAALKEAQHE